MSTSGLLNELKNLQPSEKRTFTRDAFRGDVDEEDKVIYMSVARKMAENLKYELHVLEDNMTFISPPGPDATSAP